MALLVDEDAARDFCRSFLIPYEKPRLFQCMARNKYADGNLSKHSLVLERSVLTFDSNNKDMVEENFIRELRKVDILAKAGFYKDPKKGENLSIQPEWIVVYITAYPLDEDDACDEFMQRVLERRKQFRRAMVNHNNKRSNKMADGTCSGGCPPAAMMMSRLMSQMQTCLHLSPCPTHRMLKLDVDTKDPMLLKQLYVAMKETNVVLAMETRGGFHVVIERGPGCQSLFLFAKAVNSTIKQPDRWITIEDSSGPMVAIPGTSQGGFAVRLATDEWKEAVLSAAAGVAEK